MTKTFGLLLPTICIALLLTASQASALTIETHFIGGTAPANASGKGNLTDIVNTAARMWESVYADPMTVTLYYGWGAVGSAGTHTAGEMNEQNTREISGTIMLDNSGAVAFYLDPTPSSSEEYSSSVEESQNLGGGMINVARIFRQPVGDAAGHVDLLSVVLHEMGHAMGLSLANPSFVLQSGSSIIRIGSHLPFAGTAAPMSHNNTGIIPHFDAEAVIYGSVMAGLNSDERRIPSELDIVANAQISGYSILSLVPKSQTVSAVIVQKPKVFQSAKLKSFTQSLVNRYAPKKVTIFKKK